MGPAVLMAPVLIRSLSVLLFCVQINPQLTDHALVIHSLERAGIKWSLFFLPNTFNSEVELIGVLDFVFVLTKTILKNIVLIKVNLVNLLTCLIRRWRREMGQI